MRDRLMPGYLPQYESSLCRKRQEKEMLITQETVTAEVNYRLERAQKGALVRAAREAAKGRPSRLRRWLTGTDRTPVRRVTPALP
jgi:hypothetical protein